MTHTKKLIEYACGCLAMKKVKIEDIDKPSRREREYCFRCRHLKINEVLKEAIRASSIGIEPEDLPALSGKQRRIARGTNARLALLSLIAESWDALDDDDLDVDRARNAFLEVFSNTDARAWIDRPYSDVVRETMLTYIELHRKEVINGSK